MAINQTIYSGEATDLKFSVNGEEELTKAEFEEKYEGYKVEFLFNTGALSGAKTTGKVTTSDSFKYAVQVTDAEGNKLPETVTSADFVDVDVINPKVVTEVTEVGLNNGSEWKLDYITEDDADITFEALAGLNAEGTALTAETEGVTMPAVEKVTAKTPTVAYYQNGQIVVVPGKTGTAEFEVKFVGVKEPVLVPVTINEAQKVSSIKEAGSAVKIEAAKATGVKFTVLDQYGEPLRNALKSASVDVEIIAADGTKETKDATATDAVVTLSVNKPAGTYTIVVKEDGKDNELGRFTVEAVDVSGDPDEYTLTVADKAEVDIKGGAQTLDIDLNAFIDGTKLSSPNFEGLKVKVEGNDKVSVKGNSSNQTTLTSADSKVVLSVDADAVEKASSDEVIVTLYSQQADLIEVLATINITVKNTDKADYQVTSLALKDNKKAIVQDDGDLTEADIVTALTTGDAENELTSEMIDESTITLVNTTVSNGKVVGDVVFTVEKAHGGETFSFPVEITATAVDPTLNLHATDLDAVKGGTYGTAITKENKVVKVNIADLQFNGNPTADQIKEFWTATAQQGKYEEATAAFGGYAQVAAKSGFAVDSVFSNNGQLTVYEDGQVDNINVWLQIGKKVNGEWKFLDPSDVKEDSRTIIWKNSTDGTYAVDTFTVKWVNEPTE
ncbi:hypothetical protein [Ureibacillus thermosphaericus]|uniref:hypothetical protein n=1 Tax=Ureibacillus thermosphaericus TaxID=51173 RepID=UPI0030C9DBEF